MSSPRGTDYHDKRVQPVKTGIQEASSKANFGRHEGSSGKMLSSNGWRSDPNIEYLSTDRMIEYLRSIYIDGIPEIDSWSKSRQQSPVSTASKTGTLSDKATPHTKKFEVAEPTQVRFSNLARDQS
jgi:hypothetical protein